MGEWKEYRLDEVAEITSSKRIFYSEYVSEGIPFYRSKEIIDLYNNRNISTELFISENRYNEIKLKYGVPQKDDILLTSVGSLGIPYLVKNSDKFYFKDGNLTWIRNINKNIILPQYLILWICSNIGKQKLDEVTIGSTQPALTISGLKTIEIVLPSIEEQKRITSVISSLDDKIDLLYRENKTLEAIAETLFRKWFVEDAKEEWEIKTLYDCISIVGGGTPKVSNETYWNGNICWIACGDISENHKGYIIKTAKKITIEGLNNSSAKLLPENALVISARGTVGKYSLLSKPMAFSQSNYGVLPKEHGCFFFTYLLVSYCVDELQSAAYGSVFDTITTCTFKGINIFVPSVDEIIIFENQVKKYFDKIKLNAEQIKRLTTMKDMLLVKLMSK